jgi:DNA helicase II / ATP-dependent DNA helicase PcrA
VLARAQESPLNPAQSAAVEHGSGPLLVIAGAGSGKTQTLAHRVAALIRRGVDPRRILLLTFTRRAANEMTRRAARLAGRIRDVDGTLPWAGTFHAIANRLLRMHAAVVGLDPSFTLLDREDAADLIDRIRQTRGQARTDRRFPRKGTCIAIYSRVTNTQGELHRSLAQSFPWCLEWEDALRGLFAAYVDAKIERQVLDYDDLLLYWLHLMDDAGVARSIGDRFEHVLVDEYQDTNSLQAEILRRLKPDGRGVTVVGDDAQSIYAFRAATVRNILDFPRQYDPPATVLTLAQNYRSTQAILTAANAVIGLAQERFTKDLFTSRPGGTRPRLVTVADEDAQVNWVADRILEQREAGVALRQQAVLFRAAHHSDALEVELQRRHIPFVKYGGLRFLEAAHVKDALSCLRLAENPRDGLAVFRVVQLLPGIGPHHAERLWQALAQTQASLAETLTGFVPPGAAQEDWPRLVELMQRLGQAGWVGQMGLVRRWYEPYLESLYDNARTRLGDLDQLERLADAAPTRERFLSDLILDPPEAVGNQAGPPHLDEDFLILSTIHSAKGQEWDTVFLLNVADGCIPSDMATGHPDEIEEERRLLYVAMTRAKNTLALIHPLRFFVRQQARHGDRHIFTPRTRFIPDSLLDRFDCCTPAQAQMDEAEAPAPSRVRVDVASRLRRMWAAPELEPPKSRN